MTDKYAQAEQHRGYSPELLEIAEAACSVSYAAGGATNRKRMYWSCAAEAKRRYGGYGFMPLGLWLVLTPAGAFISWWIQRQLDEWFPRATGGAE